MKMDEKGNQKRDEKSKRKEIMLEFEKDKNKEK